MSKYSKHYKYTRGQRAAVLYCNHCRFNLVLKAVNGKLGMGEVTTAKGEMHRHIRDKHPVELALY